ncbi:hypothetical protein [Mycoplana ramosa]|uniref:Uncharacterized protein n=1 Tax=Mycoplana ramosa TaxID=40837 RepID=A0ABW3Z2B4_MYCRA
MLDFQVVALITQTHPAKLAAPANAAIIQKMKAREKPIYSPSVNLINLY